MSIAYLLTGSNQGKSYEQLCNALNALRCVGDTLRVSPVYESPSWGFDHPTPFLNQAIELDTQLEPEDLLLKLLEIEKALGRTRSSQGYEARSIDIDILFYDKLIYESDTLIIPHPRLHLRRFALKPMSNIAGELIHPSLNKSIYDLLADCTDDSQVLEYQTEEFAATQGGQE